VARDISGRDDGQRRMAGLTTVRTKGGSRCHASAQDAQKEVSGKMAGHREGVAVKRLTQDMGLLNDLMSLVTSLNIVWQESDDEPEGSGYTNQQA
jgi:hypothetical protein